MPHRVPHALHLLQLLPLLMMPATGLIWAGTVLAHDLPDGQVERALQVTAYPDHIEVRYQFGMSERTLCDQGRAGADVVDVDGLSEEQLRSIEAEYLATVAEEIVERIELLVAGEIQQRATVVGELIYLHHLQFECRVIYPLVLDSESVRLELSDQNFATYPGHYRVAVRGRGGLEAVSDTAAPLLVRAPRLPIQAEDRERLVVPPFQATLRNGLPRSDTTSPGLQALPPTSLAALADPREASLPESPQASESNADRTAAVAKSPDIITHSGDASEAHLLRDSTRPATGEARSLPGWILATIVLLAALVCLPLLLTSRGRIVPDGTK
jgi:hypothetical protein